MQKNGRLLRRVILFIAMLVEAGLPIFPRIPLTGALFVLCAFSVVRRRGTHLYTLALYAIPLVVLFEMAFVHTGSTPESIISRSVNFCCAIFLMDLYIPEDRDQFATDLRPIFGFMAAQAILTVVFGYLAKPLFTIVQIGAYNYSTIGYILNYHMTASDTLIKADGFFFERGVFQLFLNLYLYFCLFIYRSRWEALFAVASVIATWSTSGVIIMLIIFGWYLVRGGSGASLQARLTSLVLATVAIVPLSYFAINNINDKFFGNSASSSAARQFDLIAGLQIVQEHPLVGLGFSEEVFADQYRQRANLALEGQGKEVTERGISNGILRLFLSVGIPLGLLLLVGMFRSFLVRNSLLIGIVLFISLSSEPVVFCPFILSMALSGLVPTGRRRWSRTASEES